MMLRARRYDAIAAGDYPEWTLSIQTMDPKDEDK
jgi:catalase